MAVNGLSLLTEPNQEELLGASLAQRLAQSGNTVGDSVTTLRWLTRLLDANIDAMLLLEYPNFTGGSVTNTLWNLSQWRTVSDIPMSLYTATNSMAESGINAQEEIWDRLLSRGAMVWGAIGGAAVGEAMTTGTVFITAHSCTSS